MCNTCGYSYDEALQMAKEVIELGLHGVCVADLPRFREKDEFPLLPNQQSVVVIIDIENRGGVLFSPNVFSL
jgi:predicted RNase H-like HicB family nuclease